ncbi:hypothetical protein KZC51_00550 [Microbacterium sp. SSW1-49]|uniref:Uncharacterized protein n=1 Tax=Microbacterium croceum TaxID=2851645 RepID=A0ABT0F985_9MICO|nr:hypothetical protein [Microbacterium croceum]MCK2034610.1 hypothetical protein [Microbacterium croceum]
MSAERTSARPTQRELLDAATAEMNAFESIGRKDLALEAWHSAREAAEKARKDCWAWLRAQYGARNPHWGWASFVLLGAALCAAAAAVLTSGFRFDPAETAAAATALAAVAAFGDLIVILASRFRPMSRGAFRSQVIVTVALVAAAAFQVSHGLSTAPAVIGAAVIGAGALIAYFAARAADPEGAEEIDTAINVALARMRPEVAAIGERMQADLTDRLSEPERAAITGARGQLPAGAPVDETTPAGGVIITVILGTWIPEVLRESDA